TVITCSISDLSFLLLFPHYIGQSVSVRNSLPPPSMLISRSTGESVAGSEVLKDSVKTVILLHLRVLVDLLDGFLRSERDFIWSYPDNWPVDLVPFGDCFGSKIVMRVVD